MAPVTTPADDPADDRKGHIVPESTPPADIPTSIAHRFIEVEYLRLADDAFDDLQRWMDRWRTDCGDAAAWRLSRRGRERA